VSDVRKRFPVVRAVLGVVAVVALLLALRMLPVGPWLLRFQAWVRGIGAAGYLVYILAYVVCCVFFLPASPLTFGAGAIFGFVKGSIIVIVGATIGATISFLLGRTLMRKRIEALTANNAKFRALDRAITAEGARIVFLIRLAPVFPYAYINFAFGLTGVRLVPYVVATFFGIIPVTLAFVWISDTAARAATAELTTTRLIINIIGGVLAVIATVYVTRVALQAIRKAGVDEKQDSNMLSPQDGGIT
jgi:uncharacterized membrane protein YdjX (TVP38/TMEM64 family)